MVYVPSSVSTDIYRISHPRCAYNSTHSKFTPSTINIRGVNIPVWRCVSCIYRFYSTLALYATNNGHNSDDEYEKYIGDVLKEE